MKLRIRINNEWLKDDCLNKVSYSRANQMSCFSFFTNLIHLPRNTLDKKGMSKKILTKGQKIVHWHKNGGFSVGFRVKGEIIPYILNLGYALLMLLLLSVYHIFIRHYILKDRVGRKDVWNLVYGKNLDIIFFGRQAIHLGERLLGEEVSRKYWRSEGHYDYPLVLLLTITIYFPAGFEHSI